MSKSFTYIGDRIDHIHKYCEYIYEKMLDDDDYTNDEEEGHILHLLEDMPADQVNKIDSASEKHILMHAIELGYPKIVEYLLLNYDNIDVNYCMCDGSSILHSASRNGYNYLKLLLSHENIDINAQTNNGKSSFHELIEFYGLYQDIGVDGLSNIEKCIDLFVTHPEFDIEGNMTYQGEHVSLFAEKNGAQNIVDLLKNIY